MYLGTSSLAAVTALIVKDGALAMESRGETREHTGFGRPPVMCYPTAVLG